MISFRTLLILLAIATHHAVSTEDATSTLTTSPLRTTSPRVSTHYPIVIDSNMLRHFRLGDSFTVECPTPAATDSLDLVGLSKPGIFTTWFKNGRKMSAFSSIDGGGGGTAPSDEYSDDDSFELSSTEHVRMHDRSLTISGLKRSDAGVYACSIIAGSGINSPSNFNLTVKILKNGKS